METAFLDHQSATPVLPQVLQAMQPFLTEVFGNASSMHQHGLRAREALAKARAQFGTLIGAGNPEEILFTSGGTEAANLAVKGVAWASQNRGKHLVVSAIEHPAVLNSVAFLETQGFTCTRVAVDREGLVDPEAVRQAVTSETILIAVHHVNQDVGTIEPIRQIADVAEERGIPLFVDAAGSAGWLPIDVQAMGISMLSLSAHRFYGPKGIGMLYRNRRVRLASLIHGGDQEQGRRAGTENVPAIVGGGVAAEEAIRRLPERRLHTAALQARLWTKLKASTPFVTLNGPELGPKRISTNLNISAEFTEGEGQLLSLDMAGVAVASGASCVSKALKVSPVLQAMGIEAGLAEASVIFTFGKDNTEEEIDYAAATYKRVIERLRGMSPLWDEFQRGMIGSVMQPRVANGMTAVLPV
jgi:cysteine desulfurase